MITAEEAMKITRESGNDINVSPILDEFDKVIRNAASNGLSHIFIMKTADQIAKECETVPGKSKIAINKIKKSLEDAGYKTGAFIERRGTTGEYLYKIQVSWGDTLEIDIEEFGR